MSETKSYIKLKLPVPNSKHYFSVFIFNDRESMYARNTMLSKNRPPEVCTRNGHDAIVIKEAKADLKNGGYMPKIGEIHAIHHFIDQEVVTHEIIHAVFWYLLLTQDIESLNLPDTIKEEEFCHIAGKMADRLVHELTKINALQIAVENKPLKKNVEKNQKP